ncbi:MAG: YciI family protein, partial [Terriglobales bacterium]
METTNSAPKFFVFRLLSPRPTFPADMTAEEGAAMQRHGAFWARLTRDGKVVVVGPVLDPAGPWGLAVVRVADESAARELEAADPIIQSGP